jgi:intraflagellar transport protein 74
MTGTGGMARKINPSTPQTNNIVYNAAFYSNLLQSKTSQILEEMERLRSEIGEEDIRRALEKQLADTTKDVKDLERQLADYNMAKDKARSGASHEDIRRQTHLLQARNKRLENEVDDIFLTRKKTEDEISRLKLKNKNMNQEFAVQKLIGEIENIREEGRAEEEKMAQLSNRMKEIESTMVGKDPMFGNKEEEKRVVDLKRSIARIEEEIQLLDMDDAAAREYLLDKAQQEQELSDSLSSIQNEIKDLATEQRELRSRLRVLNGGAAAQLLERMEEIDAFLSNSADAKANLENDRISITSAIEALQQEISAAKKLSECPMPSVNEVDLMKEVS